MESYNALFGAILATLILVNCVSTQTPSNTFGASGEPCGDEGKRCILNKAFCNDTTNECQCHDQYTFGSGWVNCYKKNTFHTEVYNDPEVLTYNGIQIPLNLPCRYLWTHTYTHLKGLQRKRVGYCHFKAHAFHKKDGGKVFIAGYDLSIHMKYDNGTSKHISLRKYGKAENGHYRHWTKSTDNDFLPNGPWGDDEIFYIDPITKLRVKCRYDAPNNLAILDVKKCGIAIQFRPYDCKLRRQQPQIPHLSYSVNCAYHPKFWSKDHVVAIPPISSHGGMSIDDVLVPGLTREMTLIYRILTNPDVEQNTPDDPNPQCAASKDILATCDGEELEKAFHRCLFILKMTRFIRCFDKTASGIHIMKLFNTCISVYCNGHSCSGLIKEITDSKCHLINNPYPEVNDFISGGLCP